jgi:hypothetical protein
LTTVPKFSVFSYYNKYLKSVTLEEGKVFWLEVWEVSVHNRLVLLPLGLW